MLLVEGFLYRASFGRIVNLHTLIRSLNLRLMFRMEKIDYWANKYGYRKEDAVAFEAGKRRREGDYSRKNLEKIVEWKSERRKALIGNNTDEEICDALTLALAAKKPRSALAVLTGLPGVALPLASAIMTDIDDRDRFTIVDWRAIEALGEPDADYSRMSVYLHEYLPTCQADRFRGRGLTADARQGSLGVVGAKGIET